MQIKKRINTHNNSLTPRLLKYRLLNSNSKLILDPKAFTNLSTDINSPHSTFSNLKSSLSIKLLNSRRSSCGLVRKTYTQDNQTTRENERPRNIVRNRDSERNRQSQRSRQIDRTRNNFTLIQPIHIIFHINQNQIQLKSFASNVATLLQEINKMLVARKIKPQPFVLQSQEGDLSLDYYLTVPVAKLNSFLGKTMHLRGYNFVHQRTVDIKSFEVVRAIGSGGFSKVFLVRFKGDGQFYAMKVISKSFILKQKKKQLVVNQRNIMVETIHPLHAKLHWAFESKHSIIFVMDYYPGGELFGLIKRFRRMPENMAKFYIIQVLLALEKLHDSGIAYRDMKPENILLDRQGHVHLADFGLAKPGLKNDSARAYSFCGSPEYMPPEIVARKGHTMTADFYSMGALLYELVTGLPPFYNRDPEKIYSATLKQNLIYSSHISSELRHLLDGLLCKEHENRLGARFGVREILAHPWFGRIEVNDYLEMKCAAPVAFFNIEDLTFNTEEMTPKNEQLVAALRREQLSSADFDNSFQGFAFRRDEHDASCAGTSSREQEWLRNAKVFGKLGRRGEYGCSSSTTRMQQFNNFL